MERCPHGVAADIKNSSLWTVLADGLPLVFVYVKVLYSRPKADVICYCHVPEECIALEPHANLPLLSWNVGCILICSAADHFDNLLKTKQNRLALLSVPTAGPDMRRYNTTAELMYIHSCGDMP